MNWSIQLRTSLASSCFLLLHTPTHHIYTQPKLQASLHSYCKFSYMRHGWGGGGVGHCLQGCVVACKDELAGRGIACSCEARLAGVRHGLQG
jgi:hypothetical protein